MSSYRVLLSMTSVTACGGHIKKITRQWYVIANDISDGLRWTDRQTNRQTCRTGCQTNRTGQIDLPADKHNKLSDKPDRQTYPPTHRKTGQIDRPVDKHNKLSDKPDRHTYQPAHRQDRLVRQTRQRDGQGRTGSRTDGQTGWQTGQTNKPDRQRQNRKTGQTDRQTNRTGRPAGRWDRQTNRAGRETERQTNWRGKPDRQTGWHIGQTDR